MTAHVSWVRPQSDLYNLSSGTLNPTVAVAREPVNVRALLSDEWKLMSK